MVLGLHFPLKIVTVWFLTFSTAKCKDGIVRNLICYTRVYKKNRNGQNENKLKLKKLANEKITHLHELYGTNGLMC